MSMSRRNFAAVAAGSAICGLMPLGAARAEGPERRTTLPETGLRQTLAPDDRQIRQKCINWSMKGLTGTARPWRNPRTGNRGSVKPTSKIERKAGQACRDFEETIVLKDGRRETVKGRACQRTDGSWQAST